MKRVKLASFGTCTECRRVMATTTAGVLRPHTYEVREGPHAVAKDDCPGGSQRWEEYDADLRAITPPANAAEHVVDVTALEKS